jgi:hypothetical protein
VDDDVGDVFFGGGDEVVPFEEEFCAVAGVDVAELGGCCVGCFDVVVDVG